MSGFPRRRLNVFLCYVFEDKPKAKILCDTMTSFNVDAWMDETDLILGKDWEFEINKAIRSVDVVIILLSNNSVKKDSFFQKEMKLAIKKADEKPEGSIYIISVRLDNIEVPEKLKRWQYFDYFSSKNIGKLIEALQVKADELGPDVIKPQKKTTDILIVHCMEYNIQKRILRWIRNKYPDHEYDYLSILGGARNIEFVLEQTGFAVAEHKIKRVVFIGHNSCKAYPKNSTYDDHLIDLTDAEHKIKEKFPELSVESYYLNENDELVVVLNK